MRTRQTVLFDFDHTLTRGDAFFAFVVDLLKREPRRAPATALCAAAFGIGTLHPKTIAPAVSSMIWSATLGLDEHGLRARMATFVTALKSQGTWVYQDARRVIEQHRAHGDRLILVTGCEAGLATLICEAFALGPFEIFGSRIERWLGGWRLAEHCYHENKLRCLARAGVKAPFDHVYTDSSHDLPLLRGARAGTLVNASGKTSTKVVGELGERVKGVEWL